MRTPFEQKAHDIQYKKKTGQTHPHEIETYTEGDNTTDAWDIVMLTIVGIVLLFGIMLITN